MDKEMQALVKFTEDVCTAAMNDGALYGAIDKTAFRQYFIEVMMPLGYAWSPEEWFNDKSLPMRQQWGESIRSIYKLYQEKVAEAAAPTTEPEHVKALREELERLSAQVAKLGEQRPTPAAPETPAAPAGEEHAEEA